MTKLVNKDTVIINTGLTDSASLNVLRSTLGQLSDGIWENSRKAERYWPFADAKMIDGNVCLVISKESKSGYTNGFLYDLSMSVTRIKDYFAKKIQAVVRENAKDYPGRGIKCTANCDVALDYMSDYESDSEILACDAHRVYKALKSV